MFGPQARAAELQAVRSAAMRQRTHEVEERIPTPAAVSLTEFARYQPISRNKGNKQYRPLVPEDIDSLAQITSTSSPNQDPDLTHCIPIEQHFSTPNPLRQAPTAPKAMLTNSSIPSSTKKSLKLPQAQVSTPCDYDNSPIWAPAQTQMTHTPAASVRPSLSFPKPLSSADFIFGLNGYSPAKPEVQLQYLSTSPSQIETTSLEADHQQGNAYRYVARDPYAHPEYSCHDTDATVASQQRFGLFSTHSDPFAFEHPYLRPHFERTSTFANDVLHHENALQQFRKVAQNPDASYDRSSKMQSFVAAQQAMAKTGKTVLHNPQLLTTTKTGEADELGSSQSLQTSKAFDRIGSHNIGTLVDGSCQGMMDVVRGRSSASTTESGRHCDPFSSGFTPQPRIAEPIEDWNSGGEKSPSVFCLSIRPRKPEDCQAICRAMQRRSARTPAPSLAYSPGQIRLAIPETDLYCNEQEDRVPFPIDDCTGSENWCTLQQLYETDREKIKGVLIALSQDLAYSTYRNNPSLSASLNGRKLPKGEHPSTDAEMTRNSAFQRSQEHNFTKVARVASPITVREGEKATISTGLQSERPEIGHDGNEQQMEGQESLQESVDAARMPLSNNFLLKDSQSIASPPARLARDPRYRPLSAQTIALHGSLQLW